MKGLVQSNSEEIDILVAAIPSYHHLKKAIFELKKEPGFKDTFSLQFVMTKVSASNFYMHRNRNTY